MADNIHPQAAHHTRASPIFDVPEFPPLRRVIPLPKRRRTLIDPTPVHSPQAAQVAHRQDRSDKQETTPDELASVLSTSMALNSYYMPLFHGGTDLFKDDIDPPHVNPTELLSQTNSAPTSYGFNAGREERDREEAGYMDHLTQPGNTKKRKVPVATHPRGGDDAAADGVEDSVDGTFAADRGVAELVNVVPPVPPPLAISSRKGRLSRATRVGLQLKEILKSRKRQLAAVLGALSHNDSFALDQALATSYPIETHLKGEGGLYTDSTPVRLSRRPERRKARAILIANSKRLPASAVNEDAGLPEVDFSFVFDSPTSERVQAANEEVAFLQSRFEAEYARQQARAAEAARQAALVVSQMQKTKRNELSQQRTRIAGQITSANGDPTQTNSEKMVTSSKSKSKKKKRSALANASNPHHLRNYVPSRLPNSGPLHSTQTTINLQNHLGPPPLRFLSAQLPPWARSAGGPPPTASLTSPEDEWICPFCEYSLFYGDEHSYRRAVRQRKKILSRRRRALERAAAAAAGRKKGVTSPVKEESVGDDLTEPYDVSSPEIQAAAKQYGVREEQDRDRDKRGERGRM